VNILARGKILELGESPEDEKDAWRCLPGNAWGQWLITVKTNEQWLSVNQQDFPPEFSRPAAPSLLGRKVKT